LVRQPRGPRPIPPPGQQLASPRENLPPADQASRGLSRSGGDCTPHAPGLPVRPSHRPPRLLPSHVPPRPPTNPNPPLPDPPGPTCRCASGQPPARTPSGPRRARRPGFFLHRLTGPRRARILRATVHVHRSHCGGAILYGQNAPGCGPPFPYKVGQQLATLPAGPAVKGPVIVP
ncbi:hypothetical protein PVAR5_9053, partial [Paecilomyces variotii No. 5]